MLETDEQFLNSYEGSEKYVYIVAFEFLKLGLVVKVPPKKLRPMKSRADRAKIDEYSDDGDIFIKFKGKKEVVEVKSRTSESIDPFNCIDDIKWSDLFVNRKEPLDRKDKKIEKGKQQEPFAYVHIHQDSLGKVVIMTESKEYWTERITKDKYGLRRPYTYCDKKWCIEWKEFLEILKGKTTWRKIMIKKGNIEPDMSKLI